MTHSDETGRLPVERTAAARAPADSDDRRGLLLVLALLTAVGPLAIDTYIPGLPAMHPHLPDEGRVDTAVHGRG
jgi:hypothetical protein